MVYQKGVYLELVLWRKAKKKKETPPKKSASRKFNVFFIHFVYECKNNAIICKLLKCHIRPQGGVRELVEIVMLTIKNL